MKFKIVISFGILFFTTYISRGQIQLPPDTALPCNSSLTIGVNSLIPINCTNSYSVDSIPFQISSFNETGTEVLYYLDDVYSNVLPISFNFMFFNQQYDSLVISSNGSISFQKSLAGTFATWSFINPIPTTTLQPRSIFGVYHDLNNRDYGTIRYGLTGVAPNRKFFAIFDSISHFSCIQPNSSTVIYLYESSNIIDVQILKKDTCSSWNHGNAVLGIQNDSCNVAYFPAGRNTSRWYAEHEAWRFTPNTPCDSLKLQWYINGTYAGISDSLSVSPIDTLTTVRVEMISYCSGQPVISASDEMLIMPQSTISVSATDTSICFGESVQLTVSGVTDAIWSTGDTTLSLQLKPSTDTTLFIQSFNSGSCTQFIQTSISVNSLPDTPIVVLNDSLLLLVSDIQGVIWYLNDSALVTASSDTLEVQANGLYYALNYNEFGCSSSSDTITIATVSVQSLLRQNECTAFPNPTSGIISFKGDVPLSGAILSLYSSTGMFLMSDEMCGNDYNLDLRPLLRESTICFVVINAGVHGIYHFPVVYIR